MVVISTTFGNCNGHNNGTFVLRHLDSSTCGSTVDVSVVLDTVDDVAETTTCRMILLVEMAVVNVVRISMIRITI